LHANNTQAVISRIEALGLLAKIPKTAVHALLKESIQVLLHVQRTNTGRKLTEISLLTETPSGSMTVLPALDLLTYKKIEPGWQQLQELLSL
jgi:pilus assembly protein CpaF